MQALAMKALVPLAEGFEELEAVTIIDVLRRAGIEVSVAALDRSPTTGAHAIQLTADTALDAVNASSFDAIVLPGGPAAQRLRADARIGKIVQDAVKAGKLVAALCAAPIVLEAAGVLAGKRATVYPGNELPSATLVDARVVVDGNIVTSRGPGTSLEFSLTLVEMLVSVEKANQLRAAMIVAA
jgi:4-methyl-5(b-hydroxyethyl)-thiazole monophosphate biosynthesis